MDYQRDPNLVMIGTINFVFGPTVAAGITIVVKKSIPATILVSDSDP